jgi:hypothetical protein
MFFQKNQDHIKEIPYDVVKEIHEVEVTKVQQQKGSVGFVYLIFFLRGIHLPPPSSS